MTELQVPSDSLVLNSCFCALLNPVHLDSYYCDCGASFAGNFADIAHTGSQMGLDPDSNLEFSSGFDDFDYDLQTADAPRQSLVEDPSPPGIPPDHTIHGLNDLLQHDPVLNMLCQDVANDTDRCMQWDVQPEATYFGAGSSRMDRTIAVEEGNMPMSQASISRRRDYTTEEKAKFQTWITENPKPSKAHKAAYAKEQNLAGTQVQNLINNHRRKAKMAAAEDWQHESIQRCHEKLQSLQKVSVDPLNLDHRKQRHIKSLRDFQLNRLAESNNAAIWSPSEIDGHSLRSKGSYSSLEEYLKAPEQSVDIKAIEKASRSARKALPLVEDSIPSEQPDNSKIPLEDVLEGISKHLQCHCFQRFFTWDDLRQHAKLCPPPKPMKRRGALVRKLPNAATVDDMTSERSFRTTSSVQSGRNSVSSINSIASSRSCNSNSSQYRIKKSRRKNQVMTMIKAEPLFNDSCRFCRLVYTSKKHRNFHEKDFNCPSQHFPCTFCNAPMKTLLEWEQHETSCHAQLHTVWFCFLGSSSASIQCFWCEEYQDCHLVTDHLLKAHGVRALQKSCEASLHARAFSTRYEALQHLVSSHGISEHEVGTIQGIDNWSTKMDVSRNWGLWNCGYCSTIGSDWDERLIHIMGHWHDQGPGFYANRPWIPINRELDYLLSNVRIRDAPGWGYFHSLSTGQEVDSCRPRVMDFEGYDIYEAAIRHFISIKVLGHTDQRTLLNAYSKTESLSRSINQRPSTQTSTKSSAITSEDIILIRNSRPSPIPNPPPISAWKKPSQSSSILGYLAQKTNDLTNSYLGLTSSKQSSKAEP